MAAASIATDEQLRSQAAPPRVSLREKIARHLDGEAPESNYAAMCEAIARGTGPKPCEDCDGTGHRTVTHAVVAQYDDREERRLGELDLLERQLAEPNRQHEDVEGLQRARDIEAVYVNIEKAARTADGLKRARRERNRRVICRACRGSGIAPRKHGDEAERGDSMFTTVTCPSCRGCDKRKGLGFVERHYGSSTGQARIHGTRPLPDPDVEGLTRPDPRDDAAAERGDLCKACEGMAYRIPISIRPALKTSEILERPAGVDDYRGKEFPEDDFGPEPDLSDPAEFLEQTRRKDPRLAAAVAALEGSWGAAWHAHRWGRRFCLWPLTDAGRALAEASQRPSDEPDGYPRLLDLCEQEREAEASGEPDDPRHPGRRRSLIARAEHEARTLERRAGAAIDEADAA